MNNILFIFYQYQIVLYLILYSVLSSGTDNVRLFYEYDNPVNPYLIVIYILFDD